MLTYISAHPPPQLLTYISSRLPSPLKSVECMLGVSQGLLDERGRPKPLATLAVVGANLLAFSKQRSIGASPPQCSLLYYSSYSYSFLLYSYLSSPSAGSAA